MIEIDGSDGGGQILRTSLSLSVITKQSFSMNNIRKKRPTSGLSRQHYTCIRAVKEITNSDVIGLELGSENIIFRLNESFNLKDYYEFDIGSNGSISLLAQTLIPIFIYYQHPVKIKLIGGLYNSFSPSIKYLKDCFCNVLLKYFGVIVNIEILDHKSIIIDIPFNKITLLDGEKLCNKVLDTYLIKVYNKNENINISNSIKHEIIKTNNKYTHIYVYNNVLDEVIFSEGPRNLDEAIKCMNEYIDSKCPINLHLSDQLLLPFCIYLLLNNDTKKVSYLTYKLTDHTNTNINTIKQFINFDIEYNQGLITLSFP